jgi:secondary thiamine-phosphate synthase enzyme
MRGYMGAMAHHTTILTVETAGPGLAEVTADLREFVARSHVTRGLLTLLCRHTSAGLLITENASIAVRRDIARWLDTLAPQRAGYEHADEGPDDMPAHLKALITGPSLAIPVSSGKMLLGTWQGVFLAEHRTRPRRREIAAHIAGE